MEKMHDFFAARIDEYDAQMLTNVEGCKESYEALPTLLPDPCRRLLDLGCGTGLELEGIWQYFPDIAVTGIDLTPEMLSRLKEKYPDKAMNLICGSYFDVPFGQEPYDCAISVQTMHHFLRDEKISLYRKIYAALTENGRYIECDYMVDTQAEEDSFRAQYAQLRKDAGIAEGEFYHFDIPFTVPNQIAMLKAAGFVRVVQVFRQGCTTILVADK